MQEVDSLVQRCAGHRRACEGPAEEALDASG